MNLFGEAESSCRLDGETQVAGICFTVFGLAQTAGSKRSFVPINKQTGQPFRRPDGGVVQSIVDDNPKTKSWQGAVAKAASEAYKGPLLDGALRVTFSFVRPRPKGHFRTNGTLKPSAPKYPATKPDVLKTARAIEDACTGVIWRDDAQICAEHLYKQYGEPARVEVVVEELA